MRALKGGLARCMPNHLSSAGRAYAAFCAPYIERFGGKVPTHAARVLRELWRIDGDLDQTAADKERARARRRLTEERRLARRLNATRRDYARLFALLERMVEQQPTDLGRLLGGGR